MIPGRHLRKFFGVTPLGVLHVGAHTGEELVDYRLNRFGRVLWVEAQESLIPLLLRKTEGSGDKVYQAVAWSDSGSQLSLNVTNNSASTSLFEFDSHTNHYPSVAFVEKQQVTTVRLDELIPEDEHFNFLNLDVQGAELEVLKGLGQLLGQVEWVYSEVNRASLYAGIPLEPEMNAYLRDFGFEKVATIWTSKGWGEALYARRGRGRSLLRLKAVGAGYRIAWAASHNSFFKSMKMLVDRIYSVVVGKLKSRRA